MILSEFESMIVRLQPTNLFRLFAHLDLPSLFQLSKCNNLLRIHYLSYAQVAWNPTRRYESWFVQVAAFKRLLRRTNAVVSGSFALQFFDRDFYPDSDMDIYLRSAGVNDFCDWLPSQGYRYVSQEQQYPNVPVEHRMHVQRAVQNATSPHRPILAVYTFRRWLLSIDGSTQLQEVQLIVVDTDPIEHILFDFHSTAVMNFLTANDAISIFPYSTFIERTSHISKIRGDSNGLFPTWQAKYEGRGFQLINEFSAPHRRTEILRHTDRHRHTIDRYSWRITFKDEPIWSAIRPYYGSYVLRVPFELLTPATGFVEAGCAIKVAEPYVWSALLQGRRIFTS